MCFGLLPETTVFHCRGCKGVKRFSSDQRKKKTQLTVQSCARVHPRLGSPFNAQLCVGAIIALLGLIYLGSSTAFNAMMSSAVYDNHRLLAMMRTIADNSFSTINNFAYLVPILTNVLLRRRTMHRGPFSMNYVTGMTVNIVSCLWLIFAIIFFSFPFEMPATGMCKNFRLAT